MQNQGLLVEGHGAYLIARRARHVSEVDQGEGLPCLVFQAFVKSEALLVQLQGVPGLATFERRDTEVAQRVRYALPVLEFLP